MVRLYSYHRACPVTYTREAGLGGAFHVRAVYEGQLETSPLSEHGENPQLRMQR